MRRILLFWILLLSVAAARNSFADADMDGVPDTRDKCRHTPFFDLVDSHGCTIEKLKKH